MSTVIYIQQSSVDLPSLNDSEIRDYLKTNENGSFQNECSVINSLANKGLCDKVINLTELSFL